MISALRITPYVAMIGACVAFAWLWQESRSQTIEITRLEAQLEDAGIKIRTAADEAAAAAEQHAADLEAVETELKRQTERAARYRAARESLEGLEDGDVAPVLGAALEALR